MAFNTCFAFFSLVTLLGLVGCDDVFSVVGGSVDITCTLPKSNPPVVTWSDFVYTYTRDPIIIYDTVNDANIDHDNAANMHVDPDTLVLTINSLKTDDSGQYICESTVDGEVHTQNFMLSVADMPPTCVGQTELSAGERLTLACSADFSGMSPPQLTWYRGSDEVESQPTPHFSRVRQTYTADVTYDMDGEVFTCRMNFGDKVDECTRTLVVSFRVMDPVFSPLQDSYQTGDAIRCTVPGNPTPDVTLAVPENSMVQSGEGWEEVIVDKSWEGNTVSLNCTGRNIFNGDATERRTSHTFVVTAPKPEVTEKPTTPRTAYVIEQTTQTGQQNTDPEDDNNSSNKPAGTSTVLVVAGIIIGALVLVIVIIVVVCVRRRKGKKIPQGAKPVPTKEHELRSLEMDGRA